MPTRTLRAASLASLDCASANGHVSPGATLASEAGEITVRTRGAIPVTCVVAVAEAVPYREPRVSSQVTATLATTGLLGCEAGTVYVANTEALAPTASAG